MLIIYDFKTGVIGGGDHFRLYQRHALINTDGNIEKAYEDFFSKSLEKIFENFKFRSKKRDLDLDKKDLLISSKIIKKSLDLRQKEPKTVFKSIINIKVEIFETDVNASTEALNINAEIEDIVLNYLLENKIKARKANKEEEGFFYGKKNNILENAKYADNTTGKKKHDVLIVGMGPAGIFAAVSLVNNGIKPIIIEKGKRVEDRIKDVNDLWGNAKFDERSNAVFGEGGAGTFSDGKLTTRKNDPLVSYILDFLVKMGAKKGILTEHKPHLGSDELMHILKNIRTYLIKNGAEVFYEEELTDIITNAPKGDAKPFVLHSAITDKRVLKADFLIIASGSNSYDTYELLKKSGVYMEKKPFAVGFRIEHKRDFINRLFFRGSKEGKGGKNGNGLNRKGHKNKELESVYYNISSKGFGGYSFCMCPGGLVINSSSKENHLCVNGMSYSGRDLENSNSAIVATVRPEMLNYMGNYMDSGLLSSDMGGLIFRQSVESRAFNAGGGNFTAPFQPAADYVGGVIGKAAAVKNKAAGAVSTCGLLNESKDYGNADADLNFYNGADIAGSDLLNKFKFFIKNLPKNALSLALPLNNFAGLPKPSYRPAVKYYDLFDIIPDFLNIFIAGSLIEFETKFRGFISNSVLTAVEAGTSSAVRIKRGDDFESVSVKGLYPCGEGSGYSGGIITSAMDGIKCSMAIIEKCKNI
ncbi:MAG: NAD(P)/FAD-dependent oxidoreductase [Deltaproteobacteria bacterium]|nr:NAD(P)/FAD-dependent oxidoreductase [Deltaproteobacteria bacterium]